MIENRILKLHWKLYIPLIGLLWLIIGITITYFVSHEKQRQRENLENRLLNVNNTVIDAYERGVDLQETVDFIHLFTDNTTLAPLHITVYNNDGHMVADNPAATIIAFDGKGNPKSEFSVLLDDKNSREVTDLMLGGEKSMISSKISDDGRIYSFAALPYEGEVLTFLSIDPMVWIIIILLALCSSVLAYFGVRAVCRNVYALQDFAKAVSTDNLPDDFDTWQFSKDELGEVSKNLLSVYMDKINAEQEKMSHERQIAMSISHELKTPVGIIKGYLDTILESVDMPDGLKDKFLLRAKENTDRLSALINDVSMVMRLQEKGKPLAVEDIDFNEQIATLAEDIKQGNTTGDMIFEYDLPADCRVMIHESLVTNALLNLIHNAVKYSGGTKMSLRWVGNRNGFHTFTFSDNGTGVDAEHLPHLFDLFYRVNSGRSRKNGGTGLGLPLVRRIINAMGGKITVDNGPEGGLRFTFTLPAAE